MFYFCTYFDSHYLIKGLALYYSLVRHAKPFRLWVLCFDDLTYKVLSELKFPLIVPIALSDFEKQDEKLLQAKENRSLTEYYFTCTPSLLKYILQVYLEVNVITYLDADLFFFSNPAPIYQEMQNGSILIIGHRFPSYLKYKEIFGIYNVGLVSFRRNDAALECLHWWQERCLEWCYDRAEDGRFADQKYLDDWPKRFGGVVVLPHKGADLAPWNVMDYSLSIKRDEVLVDEQPLIFFHFHNLKKINNWLYDPNLTDYRAHLTTLLKRFIYRPYLGELEEVKHQISRSEWVNQLQIHIGSIRGSDSGLNTKNNIFRRQARKIKNQFKMAKKFFQGDLLMVVGGRLI